MEIPLPPASPLPPPACPVDVDGRFIFYNEESLQVVYCAQLFKSLLVQINFTIEKGTHFEEDDIDGRLIFLYFGSWYK